MSSRIFTLPGDGNVSRFSCEMISIIIYSGITLANAYYLINYAEELLLLAFNLQITKYENTALCLGI